MGVHGTIYLIQTYLPLLNLKHFTRAKMMVMSTVHGPLPLLTRKELWQSQSMLEIHHSYDGYWTLLTKPTHRWGTQQIVDDKMNNSIKEFAQDPLVVLQLHGVRWLSRAHLMKQTGYATTVREGFTSWPRLHTLWHWVVISPHSAPMRERGFSEQTWSKSHLRASLELVTIDVLMHNSLTHIPTREIDCDNIILLWINTSEY